MRQTFATITQRMRLNLFARNGTPEPGADASLPPTSAPAAGQAAPPRTGRTFPADEVVWGIVIRNGFDEIDDPWYHRGITQHAYLEGNDTVSLCGFRPPQSGSRTRRRARLGLPTTGQHPMCGMCARMVVAPRPRVPVPVQTISPVAVPVSRQVRPVGVSVPPPAPNAAPVANTVSPWVRRAVGEAPQPMFAAQQPADQGRGLLARGVHADIEP